MKKKLLAVALMCSICLSGNAQIYGYDSWTQLPTRDIYDQGLMNMHLRALSETAARRQELEARKQELFYFYCEMAQDAYDEDKWWDAINYVNKALEMGYYSGSLYYIRGYSYEKLGYLKEAKSDYKKGKKYNNTAAAMALDRLNNKR